MTGRKGDFPEPIKRALAKRSSFRCAFPSCGAPTSGPSAETDVSTSNTGVACHIVAAADGPKARRIHPDWTAEERAHITNGIWMCQTHGKLIDDDESTYTVEMLLSWRHFSELRARLSQEQRENLELSPSILINESFPDCQVEISSLPAVLTAIGTAIEGSCMEQIWGVHESRAIRDALIEIAINSLVHGLAEKVELVIQSKSVRIIDNGNIFNPLNLIDREGRGGTKAICDLVNEYSSSLYVNYIHENSQNITVFSLVRSQGEIRSLTTCTVEVPEDAFWRDEIRVVFPPNCGKVYLMFPPFFALSWARRMPEVIANAVPTGQKVVLVGECLSRGVIDELRKHIPGVDVINFESRIE